MADDVRERAEKAAVAHIPPFCTVIESGEMEVLDIPTWRPRKVFYARLTFPGATAPGFWQADLRDMVTVEQADYGKFQRLKANWREGAKPA